jgi:hypothetical protein
MKKSYGCIKKSNLNRKSFLCMAVKKKNISIFLYDFFWSYTHLCKWKNTVQIVLFSLIIQMHILFLSYMFVLQFSYKLLEWLVIVLVCEPYESFFFVRNLDQGRLNAWYFNFEQKHWNNIDPRTPRATFRKLLLKTMCTIFALRYSNTILSSVSQRSQ